MKFDLTVISAPLGDMPNLARRAVVDGFDGLLVAETTQAPFLALAAATLVPDRGLDLGTAVALAFPRSPMVTAVAAWELHRARPAGSCLA